MANLSDCLHVVYTFVQACWCDLNFFRLDFDCLMDANKKRELVLHLHCVTLVV